KNGLGTMRLIAGTNTFGGAVDINAGTLLVDTVIDAGAAVTVNSGGTLGGTRNQVITPVGGGGGPTPTSGQPGTGTGTATRNLVLSGGTLSVGDPNVNGGVGQFTVFGNVANTAGSASTHVYQLGAGLGGLQPVAGTQYDQLVVNGAVSLTNATLSLSVGPGIVIGSTFTIIDNDTNADAGNGTFNGVPEGSFTNGFGVTYRGDDGNNVVLTPAGRFDFNATNAPTNPAITDIANGYQQVLTTDLQPITGNGNAFGWDVSPLAV